MVMERLLRLMAEKKATDLFLSPGSAAQLKIDGSMVSVNQQRLDTQTIEALLRTIVPERRWQGFENEHELNVGHGISGVGSFRINVFRQRGSTASVVRFIPHDIPTLVALNLPPMLGELILEKRGLLLVVGATGSGKSTTMASMLDHRNEHRTGHILTLEDPIEFTFRHKRSIVNQRQIGTDTDTLEIALRNAMRQAPDCILIGEIRDTATMSAALAYAQSGHLVLATLHANNSHHALNRIVSFYPPENRSVLLSDLSSTLKAVVSQRLVRTIRGGRIPALEVLLNTRHISEMIEQGRLNEIKDAMDQSLAQGSRTFDHALADLVRTGSIAREDALANADSATNLLWMLENEAEKTPVANAPLPATGGAPSLDVGGFSASGATSVSPAMASSALAKPAADNPPGADGTSFSEFLLNV